MVYSAEQRTIAEALLEAALARARSVTKVELPPLSRDGEEPPTDIAEQMAGADVVLAPTATSLNLDNGTAARLTPRAVVLAPG